MYTAVCGKTGFTMRKNDDILNNIVMNGNACQVRQESRVGGANAEGRRNAARPGANRNLAAAAPDIAQMSGPAMPGKQSGTAKHNRFVFADYAGMGRFFTIPSAI